MRPARSDPLKDCCVLRGAFYGAAEEKPGISASVCHLLLLGSVRGGKLISDDVPAPCWAACGVLWPHFPDAHGPEALRREDRPGGLEILCRGGGSWAISSLSSSSSWGSPHRGLYGLPGQLGDTSGGHHLAALHLKEKLPPTKVLCLVLALVGTFVITTAPPAGGRWRASWWCWRQWSPGAWPLSSCASSPPSIPHSGHSLRHGHQSDLPHPHGGGGRGAGRGAPA